MKQRLGKKKKEKRKTNEIYWRDNENRENRLK